MQPERDDRRGLRPDPYAGVDPKEGVLRSRARRQWLPAVIAALGLTLLGPLPSAQAGPCNYSFTYPTTGLFLFCDRGLYSVGTVEPGVQAYSYSSNGVLSYGALNGVYGISGNSEASGVYGENVRDGYGVAGRSKTIAVWGDSTGTSGIGVYGTNHQEGGIAIYGAANDLSGIGVYAYSAGTALKVYGKTSFSRSGILTIPAGQSSVTTQTFIALTGDSMILATLQEDRPGTFVRAAVPSPGTSSLTIYLNRAVSQATTVAYFILN
jgi:hypothetical protein